MISDGEEDETLAQVLESEVLSEVSDQEETVTRPHKRFCLDEGIGRYLAPLPAMECNYVDRSSNQHSVESGSVLETGPERDSSKENLHTGHRWYAQKQIESGTFSKIPLELFHHTLKFLSSEDLVACSLVCRFLNFAASDEGLWRCLF